MPAKQIPIRPTGSSDAPARVSIPRALAPVNGQKTGKKRPPASTQLTLWIPEELAFRLDQLARFQKSRKSSFVIKLLEQGCSKYTIDEDMKVLFAKICSQLRESVKESAA
jgi:hypothetical protein